MMECLGLISMVFFDTMYEVIELSRMACAFMIRSMFADQPYSDVVSTHGESAIRELISTFSTLSPKTSFMSLLRGSNSAFSSSNFFFSSSMSKPSLVIDLSFFPSNSFSCCTAYSSTGSTMYSTSKPFLVDIVLPFFHPVDILLQTDILIARLGGLIAH